MGQGQPPQQKPNGQGKPQQQKPGNILTDYMRRL